MGLNKPGSREHGAKKAREQGAWKQKNNRIQGALKILPGRARQVRVKQPRFPARVPTHQFTCFSPETTGLQPINFCIG